MRLDLETPAQILLIEGVPGVWRSSVRRACLCRFRQLVVYARRVCKVVWMWLGLLCRFHEVETISCSNFGGVEITLNSILLFLMTWEIRDGRLKKEYDNHERNQYIHSSEVYGILIMIRSQN